MYFIHSKFIYLFLSRQTINCDIANSHFAIIFIVDFIIWAVVSEEHQSIRRRLPGFAVKALAKHLLLFFLFFSEVYWAILAYGRGGGRRCCVQIRQVERGRIHNGPSFLVEPHDFLSSIREDEVEGPRPFYAFDA